MGNFLNCKVSLKTYLVTVLLITLLTFAIARYVYSQSSEIAIEKDSFQIGYTYIVYVDGSNFKVRNGTTGAITSYSSDDTAIQTPVNDTTANGGSVLVKSGSYSASVTLKDNVTLWFERGVSGITVTIDSGADCTLIDEENGFRKEYVSGSLYSFMDWQTGEFWYGGENRTDLIVNPTSTASYIVETDGTDTWMTNTTTGQRDWTSTDSSAVINACYGNLTTGQSIFVKSGNYTLDSTLVFNSVEGFSLIAEYGTLFYWTGSADSIMFDFRGGIGWNTFKNFRINGGNKNVTGFAWGGGQWQQYFTMDTISITNMGANGVGFNTRYSGGETQGLIDSQFMNVRGILDSNGKYVGVLGTDGGIAFRSCDFSGANTAGIYTNKSSGYVEAEFFGGHFGTNQEDILVGSGHTVDLAFYGVWLENSVNSIISNNSQGSSVHLYFEGGQIDTLDASWLFDFSGITTPYDNRLEIQNARVGAGGGTKNIRLSDTTVSLVITESGNFINCITLNGFTLGSTNRIDVTGFVTENSGTQTCADNENIAHGLAGTPTMVTVSPMNDTYDSVPVIATVDWSNVDSTNIQIGLYWTNSTAITDDVILVSWYAEYEP